MWSTFLFPALDICEWSVQATAMFSTWKPLNTVAAGNIKHSYRKSSTGRRRVSPETTCIIMVLGGFVAVIHLAYPIYMGIAY